MIRPIVKDVLFLSQKSLPAVKEDLIIGIDLMDTLQANRDRCVGMAANMIGVKKRIIIAGISGISLVMYNPVILKHDAPYEAVEGCLSLDGERKTTRWQTIEVEYFDSAWKKRRQKFSSPVWECWTKQAECGIFGLFRKGAGIWLPRHR